MRNGASPAIATPVELAQRCAHLTIAVATPTVLAMEKTDVQLRAESITRDNIASLQARLDAEPNEGKRKWLGILLAEQRALITPD
jgi:hypothetical protein